MSTRSEDVVVIGQGYVGLPLSMAASQAGHRVVGYDHSPALVEELNLGRSHVGDVSDDLLLASLQRGYRATDDASAISRASVVIICVPTPLAGDGSPDLSYILTASRDVSNHMRPGTLVILESTTYPGTTDEFVRPLLDSSGLTHGTAYWLAFSPERVDPGNSGFGIANTPKLVAGIDSEACERASRFYGSFIDTIVELKGTREAELAKLLENTYRHVNIALMNEMARICHELDIDIWEAVRGASSKPFGYQAFRPGAGVGGHCIPIDPNYLGYQVRSKLGQTFRFVELAQDINASMPAYVVDRLAEILNARQRSLRGSKILLLGVTYKPNVADLRESPAIPLTRLLRKRGVMLSFFDPLVDAFVVDGEPVSVEPAGVDGVAPYDVVALLQAHSDFDIDIAVARSQVLFDACGVAEGASVVRL